MPRGFLYPIDEPNIEHVAYVEGDALEAVGGCEGRLREHEPGEQQAMEKE